TRADVVAGRGRVGIRAAAVPSTYDHKHAVTHPGAHADGRSVHATQGAAADVYRLLAGGGRRGVVGNRARGDRRFREPFPHSTSAHRTTYRSGQTAGGTRQHTGAGKEKCARRVTGCSPYAPR